MKFKLALLLSILHIPVYGIIINGDPASTPGTNTFSFTLGNAAYSQASSTLWTFNNVNIVPASSQPYGISYTQDPQTTATAATSTFANITQTGVPPTVLLNQANPFYGNHVTLSSLWQVNGVRIQLPACCVDTAPTKIYAFSNITMADDISSMYEFTATGNVLNVTGVNSSLYYLAENGGGANVPGQLGLLTQTIYNPGFISYIQQSSNVVFDGTAAYIKGGGNITINATGATTCPFGNGNLYVGLDITGNAGGTPLFLATIDSTYTITPQAVLPSNGNNTETALSVNGVDRLKIISMSTMATTTGVSYLIALTHNVTAASYAVVAVPIVTVGAAANYGLIAQYTNATGATDIAITTDPATGMILTKGFTNPLTIGTIPQIVIGGGAAAPSLVVGGGLGIIPAATAYNNIFVVGDVVYLCTNAGIYFSKALFDQYGAIIQWTEWQITHAAFGINASTGIVDGSTAKAWYTYNPGGGTFAVRRTEWNNSTLSAFTNAINAALPNNLVQNVFDFPNSTLGFTGVNLSALLVTGKNIVIAGPTGTNSGGSYIPYIPLDANIVSTDATLLGHVVASEIGRDGSGGTNNWVFAGGQNGIGVCANAAGNGFADGVVAPGSVAALFPEAAFKIISRLPFIKKLQTAADVVPDYYLYALNSQGLYKYRLNGVTFPDGGPLVTFTPVFLASSLGEHVGFTDFIASTGNAGAVQFVIGTTQGLYTGSDGGTLTQVMLPSIQSVNRLIPQNSQLGIANNNLYVVAGDFANDQTEVDRFYFFDFGQPGFALIPIQDQTYVGLNKPFVTFPNFQNTAWWQGSCGLFGMSAKFNSLNNPIVKILKNGVQGNMSSNQIIWMYFLSQLAITGIIGSTYLTTIEQDSAFGALGLGGGFGLQVLA